MINIGNEPFGNNATTNASWAAASSAAIHELRNAGLHHTIMVDAPDLGPGLAGHHARQRRDGRRRPTRDTNILFSVHMYGVFNTAADDHRLPRRVQGARACRSSSASSATTTPTATPTRTRSCPRPSSAGIGYFGWSWSGNGGGVEYLDMVTGFNPAAADAWGTADLQRRQRHQGHGRDREDLRRRPADHAGTHHARTRPPPRRRPPRHPPTPAPTRPTPTTPPPHRQGLHRGPRGEQHLARRLPGRRHRQERQRDDQRLEDLLRPALRRRGGQSGWSGTYSQSGSTVTVSNAAWNGLLGSGRVHHLRLRGQRHRAELLDRGELHRRLIVTDTRGAGVTTTRPPSRVRRSRGRGSVPR